MDEPTELFLTYPITLRFWSSEADYSYLPFTCKADFIPAVGTSITLPSGSYSVSHYSIDLSTSADKSYVTLFVEKPKAP